MNMVDNYNIPNEYKGASKDRNEIMPSNSGTNHGMKKYPIWCDKEIEIELSDQLENELKILLDEDNAEAIGKLVSKSDSNTIRAINLYGMQYYNSKGDYVRAIFCARNSGDEIDILNILDNPEARKQAMEFTNTDPEMLMHCRHHSPLALLKTPVTYIYGCLELYFMKKD
jgi:hypothetical protein